jgi:hypothetical protein
MDRKQLEAKLQFFKDKCAENNKPITNLCVIEAFPGDDSTSYILEVTAPWVDDMMCSDAIDFLFDILWETTEEDVRQSVFSIKVLDSKQEWHCSANTEERLEHNT